MNDFLPVSKEDMEKAHIRQLDFIYVTGDAYVDHPSFGVAIISRVLEAHGYSVGIIAQPDWKDDASIRILGEPRLGFLVSAGNMDSMVNHYYVSKKHRQTDSYTPGGKPYHRPDHATIVYGNLIRRSYKKTPIIIGGIEASLRRLAHYDYWSNSFKRSVLLDSGADLISYGMGEKSIVEIADALASGMDVSDITYVRGTVFKARNKNSFYDEIYLPAYEEMKADKKLYAKSFKIQYDNTDPFTGKMLVEAYPHEVYVVQNPPAMPLTQEEMDDIYALPYTRRAHPSYDALGGVPATKEIRFSLISNRGCFGGCSFCALTFHQGRIIQTRSHSSILKEAEQMTQDKEFKGYIHDVGGPTANFRHLACDKQAKYGACKGKTCAAPVPCENLNTDHSDYVSLLRKLRKLKGVKKVFVRSGLRYDYVLADNNKAFVKELCEHHVSGQLKIAPEHISNRVTTMMGKAGKEAFLTFKKWFEEANHQLGKKQYLVPYFMSSHPGCTLDDAIELAEFLRDQHMYPEQVQDFIPTPGSLSTCMYYTGINPLDGTSVYVAKKGRDKAKQRALMQYKNIENYDLVKEALIEGNRRDLIGFGPKCLIPPRPIGRSKAGKRAVSSPKRRYR